MLSPGSMLRLYLFGPLRAVVDDRVAIDEGFKRRHAKALLALLYLERGSYLGKDELFERLWPQDRDAAIEKQTVHVLRVALESERSRRTGWRYVLERDGSYYFNTHAEYYSDLEDFQHELALAYADRQQRDIDGALSHFVAACDLRRAELLPDFRYDDWAVSDVEAVRDQYLQALEDAAELYGARGEYARAIDILKRGVREDPLRESSAAALMDLLWRSGQHAQALRVYLRLRDALEAQLHLRVDAKITGLYEAIRGDRDSGGASGLPAAS
jgi:LuxR family maltose regulon positive regulatory protein